MQPPVLPRSDIVTPILVTKLRPLLAGYDSYLNNFIISGFTLGFSIGSLGTRPIFDVSIKNLQSAFRLPHVIDDKIRKELALGRIIGPYDVAPGFYNYVISPLGVVPKKLPGEYRVIHHLSYPQGSSVNDSIPREFSAVSYSNIQDAISFIKSSPQTVFMAKLDIESAFRIMPIAPADRPLLGFRWRSLYYMDAVLPMGCSSSCAIFEAFSDALHWIAEQKLHVSYIVHFLDDFLFLASSESKCLTDMRAFTALCSHIGVPLAESKSVAPTTALTFLGITLDSVRLEARLPSDKLQQCKSLLNDFSSRAKVSLRELQSLIGVLNFACCVVVPGRAFLRRLIDLTIGIARPHYRIRLTKQVMLDLATWLEFFHSFNGKSFFLDEFSSDDLVQLYTDASGSVGYGAICDKQWFYGIWPTAWLQYGITVLELYPIVAAVVIWGPRWKNKTLCFYTDNEALVSIINKQT